MISEFIKKGFLFVVLVLVQIILCNHMHFLGFLTPYIYLFFIFFYPLRFNRLWFIFFSFLLGIFLDIFLDSGGQHAAASVTLAYARPLLIRSIYGITFENSINYIPSKFILKLISYLGIGTILHHTLLFALEFYNISHFMLVLKRIFLTSIFTSIFLFLIFLILNPKKS